MQRISAKDHGCQSVVPFEILHSEEPFEVANFEHFGLERYVHMAAMIVFTSEVPFGGRYIPFETHRLYVSLIKHT